MKTAFLFPGQGAQSVGMGKDIYEKYIEAREIYNRVEELTGKDIKRICFEGPEEELIKTENAQLAILTTSLAILEVLKNKGISADMAVGLSLGEYTALIYGGYISVEDGIKLIQKRGYYMENYLPEGEYAMAAVIGLNPKKIEEICNEINLEGKLYSQEDELKEILAKHIISPVRFDRAIDMMREYRVERFIEIGPGKTLTGFVKKDYPEAKLLNINNCESLERVLSER